MAELLEAEFPPTRPARSHAYLLGAEKAIESASLNAALPMMYEAGTQAFDAYHAGATEGRAIWARRVLNAPPASSRPAMPANGADLLADELIHASAIINAFVKHVTSLQLADVRRTLEREGMLKPTGCVSRTVERIGVLRATGFALPQEQACAA
jgi:hypothetical protein